MNEELSLLDIQGKSSLETSGDPVRFEPSKRMFLHTNFQKDETHKMKDVSCSKSSSKILKKKRHKDKLKIFKLDRHLWDPTIQATLQGKSAKYFKKKNAQISRSLILSNENTCNVQKSDLFRPCHQPSKPLEYTFDILGLKDNDSVSPLIKEPDDINGISGSDLLSLCSSFHDNMPVPKAHVTNQLFLGDLIDLGTPETFKSKVGHHDDSLSGLPMEKIDEMDEATSSQPFSLSQLVINSGTPYGIDVEPPMKPDIDSEVKSLRSGYSEEHSTGGTTLIMQGENQSRLSDSELPKAVDNQGERISSPLLLYGQNSLITKIEKQQILITDRSRQILVEHLNKDPFPKVVRENTKVRVGRRAFSMDDSLMACLPCRPIFEIEVPEIPSEVGETEGVLRGEATYPQTSELDCSSQKSSESIETNCCMLEGKNDTANNSNYEKRYSNANEISSNDATEHQECTASESQIDITSDGDKDFVSSTNMLPAAEHCSIFERESGKKFSISFEVSDMNVSKEDSNRNFLKNSLVSPLPGNIAHYQANEMGATLEPSENNIPPADKDPIKSSSTINMTGIDQVCGGPEGNLFLVTFSEDVEELGDDCISSFQLQGSSDFDITLHSSPSIEEAEPEDIVEKLEKGLPAGTKDNESDHSLSRSFFGQAPTPHTSEENLPVIPIISVSKFQLDDTVDIINGNESNKSSVDSTLISSPPVCEETLSTLDPRLSSREQSHANAESNVERDLEQSSDHTFVNTSAGSADQIALSGDSGKIISETISTPNVGTATPGGVKFEDSDHDSSFGDQSCMTPLEHWVLPPGKKFRRSLSIIRNFDEHPSAYARRGRHYEKSVEEIIRLQGCNVEERTPVQSLRKRFSLRRSSWMRQMTPPSVRRNTFIWSPTIPDRGTLYETPHPRKSIYSTPLQQNLARRMSVRASPTLGLRRSMRPPFNQDCSPASPVQYTIRDLILTICKQTEPCSFSDILNEDSYEGCCKLGEGVFGEVFSISRDGQNTVLKIIPIEGQKIVNGEKQKTYQEVLSELVIAKVLDELRYEGSDEANITSGYAHLIATSLVQGSYPETLLLFWEEFDQTRGSDNDSPKIFDDDQLFIVMEQGNGGKDLESYTFSSAKQALSIFKQIAFSLAVAEISVEFEHRDLHWGNVLVSKTSEKQIFYTINGTQYSVTSNGVKGTIIDYTLSRIKYINQFPIYNDIGKDPEMFIATGDYQFDVYRLMKKDVEDDWSRFAPKTNARWLHYLLDKMLTKVKYQRKTAKVHKDSFRVLEGIGTWVEDCGSALSIALRLVELKN